MRFFSPLLILVALLAAACGGAVLPDEFTRERADGKIPVSIPLIRQQTQKEIDGMSEGQAKAERWQQIEKDHNQCRLLSARSSRAEANEVFSACMSKRDYLYMHRLDAEHLHNDIAERMAAKKAAAEREKKEARIAAEKQREDTARKQKEERVAAEKKAEVERMVKRIAFSIRDGDLAEVKRLLAATTKNFKHDNIEDIWQELGILVLFAASEGRSEIVKALIDAGADVNVKNKKGQTALIVATREGRSEVVKILLAAGANVNAKQNRYQTAFMVAVIENRPKIAKMLLAAGANVGARDGRNMTPLMVAASEGHTEFVQMLLAAGADVNLKDGNGSQTALSWAAQNGHSEVVKILLAAGADIKAGFRNGGLTALAKAATKGRSEIIKILLAAGADVNAVGSKSRFMITPLMYAAKAGHLESVKVLIDAEVDVNAKDSWNATALTWSMSNCILKGENAQTRESAAQISARCQDHFAIAQMLIHAGADVNARNNLGNTALMYAAKAGQTKMVKIFISAGADVNVQDRPLFSGITPSSSLDFAILYNHDEVARVLLDCGAKIPWATWLEHAKFPDLAPKVIKEHQQAVDNGWQPQSCKGRWSFELQSPIGKSVATAKPPSKTNIAEAVFENTWRSIVVVRQGEKQGSGVIVRPNVVATNCHVVDSYGRIVISKHDNRRATTDTTHNAVIRHQDEDRDFCLLNVAGLQGNPAKVRRYDTLKIGEDVYAVGSPRGLDLSLSSGIISQLRQGTITRYIQTDAAISPGSSGGGLFDSDGNFIGILTRKIADEEVEGIGFAIPAELILHL